MFLKTSFLVIFYQLIAIVRCQNISDFKILDGMLKNYDRRATPTTHLGEPTKVTCELYIRSFGSINPATMDYQVDVYLYQNWKDPRLAHPSIVQSMDLNDPNLVRAIWKPEVFFPNAKAGEFQYVTVPNLLLRIKPHGEIMYMLRLKLTFSCMMDLARYPLDRQVCTMEIASFAKTTRELELLWKKDREPVHMYPGLRMPQFEIQKIKATHCSETYHIGEYSCLLAEFTMNRSVGFHLVQTYLPTVLIVVISWVSFWMDVDAVPARITLGVTTLLTISSKASDTQGNLPQVSYVKAMDVWMGTCTAFVFAALLEFTLTNYLWRKKPSLTTPIPMGMPPPPVTDGTKNSWPKYGVMKLEGDKAVSDFTDSHPPYLTSTELAYKERARRIDELSRFVFPAGFAIFNVCYWFIYLS